MQNAKGAGDRWLAGEALPGVTFALHDAVEIVTGPLDGERGTIALLMALSPEPSYLVTLTTRGDVRVRQSALRRPASGG
ncbi:MAG: hypothetical protein JWL60_265 [Gemmatimonadetes bacterium]|jgi:hypothetical protein|nr:hypothetical protein [Gemmatimonadota bacterium]